MNIDLEKILVELKAKGFRQTALIQQMLELFAANDHPLSAKELETALTRSGNPVNKTSIYRQLEKLLGEGIISEVKLSARIAKYELNKDHHHHFLCRACDDVIDFHNPALEKAIQVVQNFLKNSGHQPTEHILNLYGTCAPCTQIKN